MEINDLMEKASRFHGHICPGLAIGVLAAKYLWDNGFKYSPNEEIVAVVENDNCSVDAIQSLLGCTYGKGNLIHQDYGKLNYSFYNRETKKGVKLSVKEKKFGGKKMSKLERIQKILKMKPEDFFTITEIEFNPPSQAEIEESVPCDICGEPTMSSRLMLYNGNSMCIPCYKAQRK
ncbi:MAG: FmdE family protein [Candidatus Thorarchaeota archaeon]